MKKNAKENQQLEYLNQTFKDVVLPTNKYGYIIDPFNETIDEAYKRYYQDYENKFAVKRHAMVHCQVCDRSVKYTSIYSHKNTQLHENNLFLYRTHK